MTEKTTASAAVAGDRAIGDPSEPAGRAPGRQGPLAAFDPVELAERYGIVVVWAAVILGCRPCLG